MIVVLTGPTGAGKTDAAWALLSKQEGIVFLDCDWFASRSGFSWQSDEDVASVYRAMQSQIEFHKSEGRNDFVITLTLEMAKVFGAGIVAMVPPVFAFRLSAASDMMMQRIVGRGRVQKDREIADAAFQTKEFDRLFPDETLFRQIDTNNLTSDDVTDQILRQIELAEIQYPTGSPSPHISDAPE